jgi:DNA-binding NarL/FixJ family response regulator
MKNKGRRDRDPSGIPGRHVKKVRVMIADDPGGRFDELRLFIGREPDMEIVGEAADGTQAIEQFRRLRPDVTLVDLQTSCIDGLRAIAMIHELSPESPIVMLAAQADDVRVTSAIALGAIAYVLRSAPVEEILFVIREVLGNRKLVAGQAGKHARTELILGVLTPRELSVLRLAALGTKDRAIARSLDLSEELVKARMKSIMGKLGANDRTHAVAIAIRQGLIDS